MGDHFLGPSSPSFLIRSRQKDAVCWLSVRDAVRDMLEEAGGSRLATGLDPEITCVTGLLCDGVTTATGLSVRLSMKYILVCTYMHGGVCLCLCLCVCVRSCVYVYVYVYVYV